jgi:hypothetical protein
MTNWNTHLSHFNKYGTSWFQMRLHKIVEIGQLHYTGMTNRSQALHQFEHIGYIGNVQYYSIIPLVGKGQLKGSSRLELQTNIFSFKKWPKNECRLDSDIDSNREYILHIICDDLREKT